jgi:hypothetical protein
MVDHPASIPKKRVENMQSPVRYGPALDRYRNCGPFVATVEAEMLFDKNGEARLSFGVQF